MNIREVNFNEMVKTIFKLRFCILGYTNTVIHFNYAYVAPETSWEDEIKEPPATDNQVKINWHWFKIYLAEMFEKFMNDNFASA